MDRVLRQLKNRTSDPYGNNVQTSNFSRWLPATALRFEVEPLMRSALAVKVH